MTDTNKLKELAEAANRARRQWYTEDDCCWWTGNVDEGDFLAAANPQAILGLLERLKKAEQHWANENSNNMALIAEVERLTEALALAQQEPMYSTRRDAERYRWLRSREAECNVEIPMEDGRGWVLPGYLDELDAAIDAALEGGGK